jgi:hypothetical protein
MVRFVDGKEEVAEGRRKARGIWWEILSGDAMFNLLFYLS